jgi:uncharacterized membrane protein
VTTAAGSVETSVNRSVVSGVLLGLGIAGFLDETVFHQLLHWHHFYDRGTPEAGLVSDGLFHAGSWVATVAGLFLFADLRRRGTWAAGPWRGGLLVGIGGFELYDGIVQHKLLQLHPVREHVPNLLPYDLTFNAVALVLLAGGWLLWRGLHAPPTG